MPASLRFFKTTNISGHALSNYLKGHNCNGNITGSFPIFGDQIIDGRDRHEILETILILLTLLRTICTQTITQNQIDTKIK